MSLADKLSAMRAASAERLPADKQAIMHRATEDLRRTGILDRIVPVGSRMPAFELADHDGHRIDSDDLLAGGPLVLSFFRGSW
jgi:2-polyprenyl-6-methoxyphenol hydroxylase-like FAD-dependent oxidoreductase